MGNTSSKAAAYRQRTAAREVFQETELPSGAVFSLRRPKLEMWLIAGELPLSVVTAMQKSVKSEAEAQAAFSALSESEQEIMFGFMRRMIEYICVDPSIGEREDQIRISDLDPADFGFLVEWGKSAGGASAEAEKFRTGRRKASVVGANGKK